MRFISIKNIFLKNIIRTDYRISYFELKNKIQYIISGISIFAILNDFCKKLKNENIVEVAKMLKIEI